jgi:hypothetical protein
MLLSDLLSALLPQSGTGFGELTELGKLPVHGLFELEIQDDALNSADVADDLGSSFLVKPVEVGVVFDLARLHETRVENLIRVDVLWAVALEQRETLAGEREIDSSAGVNRLDADKALTGETPNVTRRLVAVAGVTELGEIVQRERAKGADFGERSDLGVAEHQSPVPGDFAVGLARGVGPLCLRGANLRDAGVSCAAYWSSAAVSPLGDFRIRRVFQRWYPAALVAVLIGGVIVASGHQFSSSR